MSLKLGSLFDGSGGFPLAGALCGVEPVWAAEVEPYPIAVTRSRFPNMKHLGDISKINGGEIEPVDVITFGSPCQDLSVAGKRAGLKHEANGDEETTRSGLFMEAVRIIKEMRRKTNGQYPRAILWENVPGAFSSNSGQDFRLVCEELIKIVEPSATMPEVPKGGWNYADSYVGNGWSLAYRVFDAQYWGVPQRRRRVYLVADFGGECAREILFEREGLRGYFTESGTPWQTAPTDAKGSTPADDSTGEEGRGRQLDGVVPYTLKIRSGVDVDSKGKAAGKGALIQTNKAATLACNNDQYLFQPISNTHIIDNVGGQAEYAKSSTVNGTLRAERQGLVAYSFDSLSSNSMKSKNPHSGCREVDVAKTLDTTDPNPSKNQGGIAVVEPVYSIENHPADSRVNVDDSGKVQTLTGRMGTGGGNVPMVMEPFVKSARGKFKGDAETWKDGHVANTLNTFDQGESRANELIVMATQQGGAEIRTDGKAPTITAAAGMSGNNQPVICLQGNGIDRADNAGCNGKGWREDASYTLNTIDRPAVVYAVDQGGGKSSANVTENKAPTLCTTHGGEPAVCITTGGFTQTTEEVSPTLMARDWKDPTCVITNYIVRRLTPTECARLQGFADWWSTVETKKKFTDEEYHFWLDVRNTHAKINGRKVQDYTSKQMLNWYNKLWTDSAEYKMWGNGIALSTALYCLQGIAEALSPIIEAEWEEEDAWML